MKEFLGRRKVMKWTCPDCNTDIELEEDGSVKIFPLNYYSNSLAGKKYCKLCGSELGDDKKYLPLDYQKYPNLPRINDICVYAGPNPAIWSN
jgi:hypothetical protein